ncbi:rRNA methyltransferase 3, mitochondrial [Teleopsis dalmanni]|uniref:rRNA methyltransferase 3, mitochondrial n=1 Tax=Teleopsis dalmanni TaxID=139649 RepID=UPI0018CCAE11|nr:rRNA methyltransferase 3, mitochondrial [Teleopsis dalmanni]
MICRFRCWTFASNAFLQKSSVLNATNCIRTRSRGAISSFSLVRHMKTLDKPKASDIEDALQIEANLFENSSLINKPVTSNKFRNQKPQDFQIKKFPKVKASSSLNKPNHKIIDDTELGLQFIKTSSVNDPIITKIMTDVRSRNRKDKRGYFVLEGARLIRDALNCQIPLETLIFSKKEELEKLKTELADAQRNFQTKIYKVAYHDIKIWSTLTTPPGIMAIFNHSNKEKIAIKSEEPILPITVICDNIREPNNLGSIIRTCAAIPCQQIIVTKGCCDPWESKALRGGCGGQFRVPIKDRVDWEHIPLHIPPETAHDCHVFIAENNLEKLKNNKNNKGYLDVKEIGAHNIVIIGGESHGVSSDAYKLMEIVGTKGQCLHIPLANGVESLNVVSALTLILYELRKNIIKLDISADNY